jgi:phytoene synthase
MFTESHRSIFRAGSRTYYNSTLFFPTPIRNSVSIIYAFVRQADNCVDKIPQDREGFYEFRKKYEKSIIGKVRSGDLIIDSFVELANSHKFDSAWTEAFFHSMEMDLYKKSYANLEEMEKYIYGSAEVIGLMMARILDLPDEALHCARYQGKAMQLVNFIRDIGTDLKLGRTYLPQDEIIAAGIDGLAFEQIKRKEDRFIKFIHSQIKRYEKWQKFASEGYHFIPKAVLVPIKTAADMYNWTAEQIKQDPLRVYQKAVKPSRLRILLDLLYNKIFIR